MKEQVICDHAGTKHCKEVKNIWRGCWHCKPHNIENCHTGNSIMNYFTCRHNTGSVRVKCIPYKQDERK